jgi:ABC-type sugar transport system substrate-binding protein
MKPRFHCLLLLLPLAISACQRASETVEVPPPAAPASPGSPAATSSEKVTVAMMPKLIGIDYFNACEKGAKEAAAELGDVDLLFDGPTEDKVDEQIKLIDTWIAQGVDAIAVACNDPVAISPALKKAKEKGIHVLTYDADADAAASGRTFFVNQSSADAIAQALVDEMAAQTGSAGEYAIVTSSLTAPNQNDWMKRMERYRGQKYPRMKVVTVKPSQEDQQLAFQVTQSILKAYPKVKGVWAISSVAFPGAADAVHKAGASGKVAVVGLSTPSSMKEFVDRGTVKTVILWNPVDLGYLTVHAARSLANGGLKPGATVFPAGRLGDKTVAGDQIMLGPPMRFTKENIAQFDF